MSSITQTVAGPCSGIMLSHKKNEVLTQGLEAMELKRRKSWDACREEEGRRWGACELSWILEGEGKVA